MDSAHNKCIVICQILPFFLEYSSNKISISKLVMQKNISRKVLNKVKLTKLMKILLLQHYSMNFFVVSVCCKKKSYKYQRYK